MEIKLFIVVGVLTFQLILIFLGQSSKFDRFSLLNNLSKAVSFAKFNLSQGKRLLVCCSNGMASVELVLNPFAEPM